MRVPVELKRSYRLINHGPTTLITSAARGRANVMAAAWVMALDFEPPKVAAVIASDTFTRALVDESGEFAINVPTVEQADLTLAAGSVSGRDIDKLAGLATAPATKIVAPLIEGCAAWLECRVIAEPGIQSRYDLFIGEVVAAWADDARFVEGRWRDGGPGSLHHIAGGAFFATGARLDAKKP